MNMQWLYTSVPQGIDLGQKLMPQRKASDMRRYGIDPAWQYEALTVWLRCLNQWSSPMNLSIVPRASDINGIRRRAADVRSSNGGDDIFLASSNPPATPFTDISTLTGLRVSFPEPPADVASGDPVLRSDIESMYTWMAPVRHVVFKPDSSSFSGVQSFKRDWADTYGDKGDYEPLSDPEWNVLYRYSCTAISGAWSWMNGWTRHTATETGTLSATVRPRDAHSFWFKSATIYVSLAASGGSNSSVYLPMRASFTLSGQSMICTATDKIVDCISAATAAAGLVESTSQSQSLSLSFSSIAYVAFELADDYTVPQGTTP